MSMGDNPPQTHPVGFPDPSSQKSIDAPESTEPQHGSLAVGAATECRQTMSLVDGEEGRLPAEAGRE